MLSKVVKRIIEKEVTHYAGFSPVYMQQEYEFGPYDIILHFKGSEVGVVLGQDKFEENEIVNRRTHAISAAYKNWATRNPEKAARMSLQFPVCLGDISDKPIQEVSCLVFSKHAFSNNILIPSYNSLIGFYEVKHVNVHDKPLEDKMDMVCFAGSLTGNVATDEDLKNNLRLKYAAEVAEDSDYFTAIIKPPRQEREDFEKIIDRATAIFGEKISESFINEDIRMGLEEQLHYKFQISIDGHTSPWARLPWHMRSNSIPIKIKNPDEGWREWFYSLLDPSIHYLEVPLSQLKQTIKQLTYNPTLQRRINEEGRNFVNEYLGQEFCEEVLGETLFLLNKKQGELLI